MKTDFEQKLWAAHHKKSALCGCDVCISFEQKGSRPYVIRQELGGIKTKEDLARYLSEFYSELRKQL